jgi:hypothetical protein
MNMFKPRIKHVLIKITMDALNSEVWEQSGVASRGPNNKFDPLRIEYCKRILDSQASFYSHSVFARNRYRTYLNHFQGRMVVKRGPRVDP